VSELSSRVTSYDRWSAALLDVLLPELPKERHGQVVLLACDDEAVDAAATALDVSSSDPAVEFGRLVEVQFHIARDGSPDNIRRTTARFRARPRNPGDVAPFFGACCAFVLAASRMTTDGAVHAVNYYDRLWAVLGRRPARAGQYDFSYLSHLFRYLAEWLREDLNGSRGHLHVEEGGPHHVGYAIKQCLFRERDKEHLAEFFAGRVGRRRGGLDLVRLLQVSSDRHDLTHRARQALEAPELQELVRAALTHAFETWDGSRPDPRGGRSWLASLHLSVNRKLRLTLSAAEAPAGLALDAERERHDPERDRVPLYPSELAELATRGLRWGSADANGIYLPPAGETLIFEVHEDTGLVWVPAPTADHVFVLTSNHALQHRLAAYAARGRGTDSLPRGWSLYERVPSRQLPADAASAVAARPAVALTGGLRIGPRQYLSGHGPRVEVGDIDEPLRVCIDGAEAAIAHAGGDVQLDMPAGEHHVDVGSGLVRWTVHMLDYNPARPEYGEVAYPLTDRGARAGASKRGQADGATVCGALLSDAYTGDIPLMLRARKVVLIAADGSSQTRDAPVPPSWLQHIGLPAAGVRWEAELAPDVVWALTSQQAIAVRPEVPAQLDGTARAAVDALCRRSEPRVRSLHRADRDAAVDAFLEMATLPDATLL
jgi:hypothetical protein